MDQVYEQQTHKQQFQTQLVDNKLVANGNLVEDGIKSEFWQQIVGPEIHRLISNVGAHQKPNGVWVMGDLLQVSTSDAERNYLAGVQRGLIELSNNILEFIREKDKVIAKRARDKAEETSELIYPMTEEEE